MTKPSGDIPSPPTGGESDGGSSGPPIGEDWRLFVVGYVGLWAVLIAMVDAGPPAELAAAFALSIAGGATVLYLPVVAHNLGLGE